MKFENYVYDLLSKYISLKIEYDYVFVETFLGFVFDFLVNFC